MVAHVCKPSYLEGGDQEDYGLRPAQIKGSGELTATNKSWVQWSMPVISAM
jgi:hypothetical protein